MKEISTNEEVFKEKENREMKPEDEDDISLEEEQYIPLKIPGLSERSAEYAGNRHVGDS